MASILLSYHVISTGDDRTSTFDLIYENGQPFAVVTPDGGKIPLDEARILRSPADAQEDFHYQGRAEIEKV